MSTAENSQIRPASEAEVEEAVNAARGDAAPIEIVGGGTKRGLGRPTQTAATLSLDRLTGITLYEPSELVIAAKAGTPLAQVEETLRTNGQRLSFEPVTLRSLYGTAGEPTIGAVAACNLSGPRRVHAGAARDGLIGVRLVTGRGEAIKSGGRVMKNVTGYDLVKLTAGAFGTLGVITEVTFKVLPSPEAEASLVVEGLDDVAAVACMAAGLGSPWEVTGAAHLQGDGAPARTLLRLEGFETQMRYRSTALAGALAEFGPATVLRDADSASHWSGIAELAPLTQNASDAVWKISTTPSRAPRVAEAIGRAGEARLFYDWGGGLLWVAVAPDGGAGAGTIRDAVRANGGHATLMRAPEDIRSHVDVFEPLPAPLMELTRRLKDSFDPDRVLNPGRMYADV